MEIQNQAAEVPSINLELNPQEVQIVFAGLQELPIRVAQGLWRKIEVEISKQVGSATRPLPGQEANPI